MLKIARPGLLVIKVFADAPVTSAMNGCVWTMPVVTHTGRQNCPSPLCFLRTAHIHRSYPQSKRKLAGSRSARTHRWNQRSHDGPTMLYQWSMQQPRSNPIAQFLLVSVAFGVPMGLFFSLSKGLERGMVLGIASGLLFGLAITAFARRVQSTMTSGTGEVAWDEGERVITEGLANHFQGAVSNGGLLALTQRRLRFRGHALNVSQYDRSWTLDEVESVAAVMTAFIIPNGLRVTLRDGSSERFVVSGRHDWVAAIDAALQAHRSPGYRMAAS